MENQIEVEIGTYHRSDDVVVFDIAKHSCAKLESARPLTRRIIYKFSDDLSKVTFTFGPNKNVTFKRLNKDEANSMDQIVANAITGCFVQGSFKQGKVEKPEENLSVSQKVDELESEAQKALKDEGIESKDASLDVKANKSGTTEL
jgi:hypothetical protein